MGSSSRSPAVFGRTPGKTWMKAEARDAGCGGWSPRIPGLARRAGDSEDPRHARPRGVMGARDRIARLLGDAYSRARHLLQMTLLFVLLLACIYALRTLVVLMFPPGEYLRDLLDLVDTYAALAGTIGYVAWMSVDLFFLMKEQWRRRSEA